MIYSSDETGLFSKDTRPDLDKSTLNDLAVNTVKEFRESQNEKKRRRDAMTQRVLWAWIGKTLVDENEIGLIEEIEIQEGEIYVVLPLFGAMLRSIQKEAIKSNPQFGYTSAGADIDQSEVNRLGATLADYYGEQFFTSEFEQEDVMGAIAAGFSVWELWWDREKGDDYVEPEYACDNCDWSGEPVRTMAEGETETDDAPPEAPMPGESYEDVEEREMLTPQCPSCMSPLTRRLNAGEQRKVGDACHRGLSPFQVNGLSYTGRFDDAKWFSVDDIIDISEFREEYPEVNVPQKATLLSNDYLHLRRMRAFDRAQVGLESSFNLTRSPVEMLSKREVIRSRDYIDASVYKHVTITTDAKLWDCQKRDWVEIKAGKQLIDIAPDGICVHHTGGVAIYRIDICDWKPQFILSKHSVKMKDMFGMSFAAAALECQYNIDELASQATTAAYEMGAPTYLYDETVIPDGVGAGGRASLRIPIHRKDPTLSLDDLVKIIPPAGVSPYIMQLIIMYKQDMQGILGAYSPFGGGLPDAAGKTATGVSIATSQMESQQAMYLALRAEAKAELMRRVVKMFGVNADVERVFRLGGPYSGDAVIRLKGGQLPQDMDLYVKKDSYWPRELYQRQNQYQQYVGVMTAANQMAMLRMEPLTLAEEQNAATIFQQDIATNNAEIAAEIGNAAIKKVEDFFQRAEREMLSNQERSTYAKVAKEFAEQAHQEAQQKALSMAQPDPQSGVTQIPQPEVEPVEDIDILIEVCNRKVAILREGLDPHRRLLLYYRDWAKMWRGRNAPEEVLRWVDQRASKHDQLSKKDQGEVAAVSPAGGPQGAPQGGPTGQSPEDAVLNHLNTLAGGGTNTPSNGFGAGAGVPQAAMPGSGV